MERIWSTQVLSLIHSTNNHETTTRVELSPASKTNQAWPLSSKSSHFPSSGLLATHSDRGSSRAREDHSSCSEEGELERIRRAVSAVIPAEGDGDLDQSQAWLGGKIRKTLTGRG